jgi:hypothetical protein
LNHDLSKKLSAAAVGALLLCTAGLNAAANSGPASWENAPSFSVTALKSSPVTVEREDLTFDFSNSKNVGFSPQAQVTASYEMRNPTAAGLTVQMAFPLISSLGDLSAPPEITLDGKNVAYRILSGPVALKTDNTTHHYFNADGSLNVKNLPSFEQILKIVQEGSGVPQRLKGSGKRYDISTSGRQCEIAVDVSLDPKSTALISAGFNGFRNNGGSIRLTGQTDGIRPVSVLIVGKDGKDFKITYTDSNSKKVLPGDVGNVLISQQNIDGFFDQLVEQHRGHPDPSSPESRQGIRAALEKYADEKIAGGQTVIGDADIYDFYNTSRFFVLAYEVPFAANASSNVIVSYPMSGAMNASVASKPVYSYGYLLNPAKGWAGFQDLTVTVIPPGQSPYVIKSSLPFARAENGSYSAKLGTLPSQDITFTLYDKPQIAPYDKPLSRIVRDPMPVILTVFGVLATVIILVGLCFYAYKKYQNKKGGT